MENKLVWHQVVLVLGMVVLGLNKVFFRKLGINLDLIWWSLGMVLGFLLVFGDRVLYAMVTNPRDGLSLRFSEEMKNGQWLDAIKMLLSERSEQKELAMRSVLFVFVYLIMGFFMMSSSQNQLGKGLVLGLGLHLMFDMTSDFVYDKQRFNLWFWQIKRQLPEMEKRVCWVGSMLVFLFLAINL